MIQSRSERSSAFRPDAGPVSKSPSAPRSGAIDLADFLPHDLEGDSPDNPSRYFILQDFASRFLPDARDIFVYLPEAYVAEPEREFPVFYLHDGQNLFDGRLSYVVNRTWRAHTTTDALTRAGVIEPIILVGVANTGLRRMAEYTPTSDFRLGGGEGALYGHLLIQELKPLIDRCFRTLPDRMNTALGGSSLGGLITLALGIDHAQIFGKLAVMSPSVWWDHRSILDLVNHARPRPDTKIWLDMGMSEGLRHLRDCDLLHRRLLARGWHDEEAPTADLHYLRVPGGVHDENAWARRFDEVLAFLFPA